MKLITIAGRDDFLGHGFTNNISQKCNFQRRHRPTDRRRPSI